MIKIVMYGKLYDTCIFPCMIYNENHLNRFYYFVAFLFLIQIEILNFTIQYIIKRVRAIAFLFLSNRFV